MTERLATCRQLKRLPCDGCPVYEEAKQAEKDTLRFLRGLCPEGTDMQPVSPQTSSVMTRKPYGRGHSW